MRTALALLGVALLAAPLAAQQAPDSAAIKLKQRIDAIIGIPRKADEIRRSGVPDSTLRGVLDVIIKEKLPAEEAAVILETEAEAAREHGPTDNFGAFVQSQLAAGKRGRELAAAIRAEHQARGKGKPAKAGREERDDEPHARDGRPDDAGKRNDDKAKGGRPDDAGAKGKANKPETPGAKNKRPY